MDNFLYYCGFFFLSPTTWQASPQMTSEGPLTKPMAVYESPNTNNIRVKEALVYVGFKY